MHLAKSAISCRLELGFFAKRFSYIFCICFSLKPLMNGVKWGDVFERIHVKKGFDLLICLQRRCHVK